MANSEGIYYPKIDLTPEEIQIMVESDGIHLQFVLTNMLEVVQEIRKGSTKENVEALMDKLARLSTEQLEGAILQFKGYFYDLYGLEVPVDPEPTPPEEP